MATIIRKGKFFQFIYVISVGYHSTGGKGSKFVFGTFSRVKPLFDKVRDQWYKGGQQIGGYWAPLTSYKDIHARTAGPMDPDIDLQLYPWKPKVQTIGTILSLIGIIIGVCTYFVK